MDTTHPDLVNLNHQIAIIESKIQQGGDSDLHLNLACILWEHLEGWFEAGLLPPELVISEDWLVDKKRGKANITFIRKERKK